MNEKMNDELAISMAKSIEDKLDMNEPCTKEELAIYTLYRSYGAMKWASEYPIQAWWCRFVIRFKIFIRRRAKT